MNFSFKTNKSGTVDRVLKDFAKFTEELLKKGFYIKVVKGPFENEEFIMYDIEPGKIEELDV